MLSCAFLHRNRKQPSFRQTLKRPFRVVEKSPHSYFVASLTKRHDRKMSLPPSWPRAGILCRLTLCVFVFVCSLFLHCFSFCLSLYCYKGRIPKHTLHIYLEAPKIQPSPIFSDLTPVNRPKTAPGTNQTRRQCSRLKQIVLQRRLQQDLEAIIRSADESSSPQNVFCQAWL